MEVRFIETKNGGYQELGVAGNGELLFNGSSFRHKMKKFWDWLHKNKHRLNTTGLYS